MPRVSDHTALLSGLDWAQADTAGVPVVLTYAFLDAAEAATHVDASYPNDGFTAFTAAQKAAFRAVVAEIESVCGLRFVEIADPGLAAIDLVRTSGSPYAGWAGYPFVSGSTITIDAAGDFSRGSAAFGTMLHELGHAVGLKHPFEGSVRLRDRLDTTEHTVMSYTHVGGVRETYAPLDRDALRALYGRSQDVPDGMEREFRGDLLVLRGTAGRDTITGPIFAGAGVDISGRGGADRLIDGGGDDRLSGGGGRDTCWASEGDDLLFGGAAADRLVAAFGADTMEGGAGADVFVLGDSYGQSHVIADFEDGADRIEGLLGTPGQAASVVETAVEGGVRLAFGFRAVTVLGVTAAMIGAEDFV